MIWTPGDACALQGSLTRSPAAIGIIFPISSKWSGDQKQKEKNALLVGKDQN